MADNYIEQRMADMRAGKLKPAVPRRHKRPLEGRSFHIPDAGAPGAAEEIENLRRQGADVTFSGGTPDTILKLTRVYGARHISS